MKSFLIQTIRDVRNGIWHFKNGGLDQFQLWRTRRFHPLDVNKVEKKVNDWSAPDFDDYLPNNLRSSPFKKFKVAVILDDFSMLAWSFEFTTIAITPANWESVVTEDIDFLLVESAWNGNGGAWQYQLTGENSPSPALVELLSYCSESNIPTVFWNKEDPPHFKDFLKTAKLFDYVFTTDIDKVPEYTRALGHDRVNVLSFAAQPAIHNPIRLSSIHQVGDIAFGGMYFTHKFPERREQLDLLLSAAASVSTKMEHGLTIFSRFVGGDERYQFPSEFQQYVVGSLPYTKMLTAYRAYKVFLNVNSVLDSPSMCARRIFEISACGTPVITTNSSAIRNYFRDDEVQVVTTQAEAQQALRAFVNSKNLRDRFVHRAQRKIWSSHTYAHRANQILNAIELVNSDLKNPSVTVVSSTNRPNQIEHLLEQVGSQTAVELELQLVTHGFVIDPDHFRTLAKKFGIDHASVHSAPAEWTLGKCLNLGITHAEGEIIAKFDDDDIYCKHYLEDQLNALQFSGADLVGKEAAFAYLQGSDSLVLRRPEREHQWTHFVAGPTLVGHRKLFKSIPFRDITNGEDSAFLRDVLQAGFNIYSSDRFNFIQFRSGGDHTWQASDLEFLANGIVETSGMNINHVTV